MSPIVVCFGQPVQAAFFCWYYHGNGRFPFASSNVRTTIRSNEFGDGPYRVPGGSSLYEGGKKGLNLLQHLLPT